MYDHRFLMVYIIVDGVLLNSTEPMTPQAICEVPGIFPYTKLGLFGDRVHSRVRLVTAWNGSKWTLHRSVKSVSAIHVILTLSTPHSLRSSDLALSLVAQKFAKKYNGTKRVKDEA